MRPDRLVVHDLLGEKWGAYIFTNRCTHTCSLPESRAKYTPGARPFNGMVRALLANLEHTDKFYPDY